MKKYYDNAKDKLDNSPQVLLFGKGNKVRAVPLMEKTVEHLKQYMYAFHKEESLTSTVTLFYVLHKGKKEPMNDETVRVRLQKYADAARKKCSEVPQKVHPHLWRHTRAMHLYDRSDGFYRRQLVLTTKEKPAGRMDDPDLAQKMKVEVEGIFLWAFEGLQRLASNNFKFTESERTKANRESVKRDNNNIFDFMESEGYIRLKADASISSKELYEIYRMWCEENSLPPLKSRSFSDSVVANLSRYNLEHTNKITNSAGRRVWGFMGIEAVARPNINGFYDVSPCTYVPEEWRD